MSEVVQEVEEPETETAEEREEGVESPGEPEDEPESPDALAAAQEPSQAVVDEAAMEKFYKSLGTRTTTFRNWVAGELGEQALDLSPCPLCSAGIMGHLFPVAWIQPTSDLEARLLDVLKRPVMPEYQLDPNTRPCGICQGLGMTKTGSQVPGKTERVCRACKGSGYLALDGPEAAATNGTVVEDEHALPNLQPLVTDDTDNWGHPKYLEDGMPNPNWGRQPQYVDPAFP